MQGCNSISAGLKTRESIERKNENEEDNSYRLAGKR